MSHCQGDPATCWCRSPVTGIAGQILGIERPGLFPVLYVDPTRVVGVLHHLPRCITDQAPANDWRYANPPQA